MVIGSNSFPNLRYRADSNYCIGAQYEIKYIDNKRIGLTSVFMQGLL